MAADLYTEWLGIPEGRRPPDYYALLGLPRFCKDKFRIDRAASEALARLDRYQLARDPAKQQALQRMIAEVAKARVGLVDPKRREEYDKTMDGDYGFEEELRGMPEMEILTYEGPAPKPDPDPDVRRNPPRQGQVPRRGKGR